MCFGMGPRVRIVSLFMTLLLLLSLVAAVACGHSQPAHAAVPPPPAASGGGSEPQPDRSVEAENEAPSPGRSAADADIAEPSIPSNSRPLVTETGLASWYGPPYHNRVGSNGEVYNMHAMTAAHRTFPLGSIVRVTNLQTGHSALVRITDRGPFIPGRIVDLSLAAAQRVDVVQPGVAKVKVELLETPAALDSGGKWAVQIGGFLDEEAAAKLADHLTRRYHTAKVLRFKSPAGDWWIRVRVLEDDHARAQQLAAETRSPEGAVFLVRLD
jgi:rare lipoprotein A